MNDLNLSELEFQDGLETEQSGIKEVNLHDVAIIGISLRFPYANTIKEYENNLSHGFECLRAYPKQRRVFSDKYLKLKNIKDDYLTYHTGGYLESIDYFDHEFFGIPPKEAALMDPHQRMFLQVAWETLEDGGYGGDRLQDTRTGVYIGYTPNTEVFDYRQVVTDLEYDKISMAIPGNLHSIMPSRIGYFLDLKGPSLLVDTACSSSLVAVHLACQGIHNNDCDYAIAGGIRITLFPLGKFGNIGIESSDGHTRAFDDKADGTGVGEGVAAVLLKPLHKAIQDHDSIYAIIKGSAINQDGASAGITAPSLKAQEDVMIKAWQDANINPETLQYIEAHGTGTKLGDPIEVQSINNAFSTYTNKKHFCALSSVKSNLGHLNASAGIAGLIKGVLALKNKKLYPSINFNRPNKNINFDDSAVFVNNELKAWKNGKEPLRCGINSFGFSGTNCHVVLEEAPDKPKQTYISSKNPEIFTLSARDYTVLFQLIHSYINYLKRNLNNDDLSIQNLCYTANSGRGHYEARLALIVHSKQELLDLLSQCDVNNTSNSNLSKYHLDIAPVKDEKAIRGVSQKAEKLLDNIKNINESYESQINELAELFVAGADIDWEQLYFSEERYRVNIPVYSFNKINCLLDIPDTLPEHEIFELTKVKIGPQKLVTKQKELTVTLTGNTQNSYTEYEKQVAQAWGDILGYKELDIKENFFHLGGESISLMQIIQRLSEQYDMQINMKDFMNDATIKGLAEFIQNNHDKTKRIVYPQLKVDTENTYEPFPLTDIQMAYLMGRDNNFELGGIGTHIYSELETSFDISRLNPAFNKVIARHPMLRAVFLPDSLQQQILKEVPFYTISCRDISSLTSAEQLDEIEKERIRMSHHVFDPTQWPLFEMTAMKLGENKNYIFFGYDMLIADGLSIQIFENEIVHYYHNPNTELPAVDFTFRDYILTYEEFKNTEHYQADKEYHLNRLDDLPYGPSLLTSRPLPTVDKPRFNRKQKILDRAKWEKLKNVARNLQVTPSALILTAYSKVLNFWSVEDKFTINLTVFNRYPFDSDINKIIGDFTSVILMDMDYNEHKSITEKIQETHMHMMEMLSHRHFDGVSAIRELSRQNNTGAKALMPVVFTSMLIDEKTRDFELTERLGEFTYGVSQTSQVYLDNQLTENNGKLSITWDYEETVFDQVVIDTMFEQYISLIESIIAQNPIENFTINKEDEAFIAEYNDTDRELFIDTLDNLFYDSVNSHSTKIAVKAENRELTYEQLNEKSNKIARYLLEQDVTNNTCVAVITHRQPESIAYMMGILKAGATYVPIEPDYPEERREYIMNKSNASIILDADTYELKNMDKYSSINVSGYSAPDALAYIIYTSGSTGNPKGVMITHEAAANTIVDINERFGITSDDRILGLSSMCFDLSVYDIYGTFSTGATLFMVPDIKNTEKISEIIAENQITFWNSVPSVMNLMVENLSINENKKYVKYESLRHVLLSGDWIPIGLPEKIKNYFPNATLTSLGGATEASVWSIYFTVDEVKPEWTSIPYGYPLYNQKFYVLNSNLDFCPVGLEGELFIGGKGVAHGYLNDKEKTEKAFIHHPSLGYIYRTGDYGILHKEGYIEFKGRKDNQIKIRGHRIELGEIESNLVQHGGVNQVITTVSEFEPGDKKIVAYVTPSYLMDWDYEYSGNLLSAKQKYVRLPFNGEVELVISGKSYRTKAVDLSPRALTIEGNYDAGDLIEAVFAIPGHQQKTRIKGELVIITQEMSVILFKDKHDHINTIEMGLDEYKRTIPFDTLNDEFNILDLKLEYTSQIKMATGTILEFKIRHLTSDGVVFTGITEEMKKDKGDVEVEFTISGLPGSLSIPGTIEWTKENITGIRFNKTNETIKTLIELIIHYSDISGISAQVLKDHLNNRVPDYMLPYTFIILDYLPLTANQKIDRKKLPNPTVAHDVVKANIVAPRDSIEQKIFDMWSEILKTDTMSIHDNFFELGGDSLQVYQIAMRAEAVYKVKIPIDSLYKEPTIATISNIIRDMLEKSGQIMAFEEEESSRETDVTYYWLPGVSWNLQDSKVVINDSIYDAAELFPKFYFLTQNGSSINTLLKEFKGKDENRVKKAIEWFINDGILVNTITSWHKIFAPHKNLFNNRYDQDLLFDKDKYYSFKEEQMNRCYDGEHNVSIQLIPENDNMPVTLLQRRSYRNFNAEKLLSYNDFSLLLSVFRQHKKQNGEYVYYYASSGGLYPIDIYLYVKENRVENVEQGLYYYHPTTHKLNLISKTEITESSAYVKNKEIFNSSAITIYMIFNAEASMPVYGADGYFYACLDAGIMISSLTQVAETCNAGLCSIGDMNFDVVKDEFNLNEHQVLLHNIELGIKPEKILSYDEIVEEYEKNKDNYSN